MAATSPDSAVIVNSGSTNALGYKISISSDGKASAMLQKRDGSPVGSPKPFALPAATTARLFSDLATARAAKLTGGSCMKSASFGSSTHVSWQGWTSPDLECPTDNSAGNALLKDVQDVREASGINTMPKRPL